MNDGRTGAVAGLREAGTLTVHLPGPPVAQGRPRFRRIGNRVATYDPAKSRAWKRVASTLLRAERLAKRVSPFFGPVEVVIVATFPLPANDERKAPVPRRWCTKRNGDADNLAKSCLDAATDAGVWLDDAQVARLIVERWVAAQGEAPGVVVEVRELATARGEGG